MKPNFYLIGVFKKEKVGYVQNGVMYKFIGYYDRNTKLHDSIGILSGDYINLFYDGQLSNCHCIPKIFFKRMEAIQKIKELKNQFKQFDDYRFKIVYMFEEEYDLPTSPIRYKHMKVKSIINDLKTNIDRLITEFYENEKINNDNVITLLNNIDCISKTIRQRIYSKIIKEEKNGTSN